MTISRRSAAWVVAVTGGLLGGWIAFVLSAPPPLLWPERARAAEETADRIEAFRLARGRLPAERELGVRGDGSTFFGALPDGGYETGFSVGFDEAYSFNPQTRRWSFDSRR